MTNDAVTALSREACLPVTTRAMHHHHNMDSGLRRMEGSLVIFVPLLTNHHLDFNGLISF